MASEKNEFSFFDVIIRNRKRKRTHRRRCSNQRTFDSSKSASELCSCASTMGNFFPFLWLLFRESVPSLAITLNERAAAGESGVWRAWGGASGGQNESPSGDIFTTYDLKNIFMCVADFRGARSCTRPSESPAHLGCAGRVDPLQRNAVVRCPGVDTRCDQLTPHSVQASRSLCA